MSLQGTALRVNNINLNVHIEGEGPAILLLHGFPDSSCLWRHMMPILSGAGFRVIAPDQRGFGESDAPRGVESYRLTAAINWYRANIRLISTAIDIPTVSIPVMGVWSSEDLALAEDQMINSVQYVDNTFRYERLDGCSHLIPLDEPETITALLLDFLAGQVMYA